MRGGSPACCFDFFFFFSSRRRHTRSLCDWSSDVCSSDLFQEFLREAGITVADDPAHKEAVETHTALRERVQATRNEITNLEEQREATRKRLDRGGGFFNRLLSSDDPADLKASLHDIEGRLKHQELKLEELGPQVEDARQKLDFFRKGKASRLGEYLDEPENAQRLFDPKGGPESAPLRAQLL